MRFSQLGRKPDSSFSCRFGSNATRVEMLVTLSNPFTWDSIGSVLRRWRKCATYVASTSGGNVNEKIAEIQIASGSRCFCRTESKRDADSVSKSKQDTDNVTGEFFPARTSTTTGERVSLPPGVSFGSKKGVFLFSNSKEMSFDEFTLPLYRHGNDRDFFLCGEDDQLVTGAETDASACEVFERTFTLVSCR